MPPDQAPGPWHSFLVELSAQVSQEVELHCIGGFVLSMLYGMPRPTADVDVLCVVPQNEIGALQSVAGPYLASPERHDLTIRLWREAIAGG